MSATNQETLVLGGGREIWREIVGTERDADPCRRFGYAAERLISDASMRRQVMAVVREMRDRCIVARNGTPAYRFARSSHLSSGYLVRLRCRLPGLNGDLYYRAKTRLLPLNRWMNDGLWLKAFSGYCDVLRGMQDPMVRYLPLATLFSFNQYALIEEFSQPARHLFGAGLICQPLMEDLAEFLAVTAAAAACGDHTAFEHAVCFLHEAVRTPPLVVRRSDKTDLILVCDD